MRIVVADFETYFDTEYTLSKLSTEAYIRDPRFEIHGCAVKWSPQHDARWYDRRQFEQVVKEEDWSDVFLISHHAAFDHFILNHHYGVRPKMSGCTMSMARLLTSPHLSVSLDNVRKYNGIAAKTTPYNLFRGKHWHELTPYEQQAVADGAVDEVESIWKIFQIYAKDFPAEEFEVADTTIKMFTIPALRADVGLLAQVWENEAKNKNARSAELNITEAQLQSADQFAQLLRDEGVEPEKKNGKNGEIYAFAKNDQFMMDLLDHDDDRVRLLAEARIGAKSTLMQTRAETLGYMAQRGPLCVYLRYAGAGTLRPSGGDGSNWLNFKRSSPLRKAILAPEGYLLAPVDSSQIEFRVCMYLAGQENVLDQLRRGEDPYVDIASEFYGEKVYKPEKGDPRRLEMEQKRGCGKQAKLMCQYGAAGKQFQKTAKAGLYGPPIDMALEDAERFVALYREMHPAVCAKHTGYWAVANKMIARLGGGPPLDWGPLHIRDHRIYLPNGCPMIYDTLEFHKPEGEEWDNARDFEKDGYWRVRTRQGWKKMWGSKLVQNICEAVSRVIVTQAMIRITRMGYRILNHPYDELLVLIPKDGRQEEHLKRCKAEMKRTPTWLPGIPLDCEGHLGERYEK